MDDVVASCKRGFPLEPSCARGFSLSIFLLFSVFNFIVLCFPFRVSYRRLGSLPLSFFCSAVCLSLLVAIGISLVFYIFYIHSYTHIVLVFCLSKIIFYLSCLLSLIKWRDQKHLPFSLAFSFTIAVLIQLIPFCNWKAFFTRESFRNGEFAFYATESGLTVCVLISTMVISPLKSDTPSTWTGFSRKVSLILPYVWPRKSFSLQLRVAFCLFLLVFGRLINVALPLYSKWIVDSLSKPGHFDYSLIYFSTFLKFLQGNGAMGGFLNTLRSYLWIPVQQYTTRELEVELFAHLHSLSLRWHLSRKTGLVLRVMDRGTSSVNSILNYILFNIVPTIADIIIAVVFFFSTFNAYFGGIVFLTMTIYLILTIFLTEWRTKFRREMNDMENKSSAIGTDSLLNYETVKYYGNEEYEVNRFRHAIDSFQVAEWRSNASLALLNFTQNSIIGLGMLGGSILVAYFITTYRDLSVGDYVLFTTYMLQLYTPLNFFGTVYRTLQRSFIDMESMFDLMDEEVEVQDLPSAIEYKHSEGTIAVENLSFAYNDDRNVLNEISFKVSSGETVALVGPSGSGKSTIIRLLFRLFEIHNGSICYDGTDIRNLKLRSLRKEIGVVPQDTVLFNDTIKYNIKFGDPTASDEEIMDAAKAAHIHEKIITLPDGYETLVGERGLKLSGGEKQRVAIARTVLKKPKFIFLDEATSALDTHTERAIQRCLENLCVGRTTVVVAHRLSTVVGATNILVLDKGRIVERGSHAELIAKEGVYYHMWQSQNTSEEAASPPRAK